MGHLGVQVEVGVLIAQLIAVLIALLLGGVVLLREEGRALRGAGEADDDMVVVGLVHGQGLVDVGAALQMGRLQASQGELILHGQQLIQGAHLAGGLTGIGGSSGIGGIGLGGGGGCGGRVAVSGVIAAAGGQRH